MIGTLRESIQNIIRREFLPVHSQISGERLVSIDLAKILAAFLVVFYHFSYYKLDYGYTEGSFYLPNANRIFMCFASCSVPLFFLVNGFLMSRKERKWQDVYYKAFKILVLTVLWSYVGFPSWFFRTLMAIYLLYPVIWYLWMKKKWLFYLLELLFVIMPFTYNYVVLILKAFGLADLPVTGLHTMYGLLYFMIGFQYDARKKYRILPALLLLFLGWAMVVTECTIYTNLEGAVYDGVNHAFPTMGALLLTLGLCMLLARVNMSHEPAAVIFFGQGVLAIYLMHMGCARVIKAYTGIITVNLPEALLGTALICLVCCLVNACVRRIPVLCSLVKI